MECRGKLHGALAQLGERMTGSHEVTGSIPISSMFGALAQLGERMTGSHEVTGSIPISSTTKHPQLRVLFFCPKTALTHALAFDAALWTPNIARFLIQNFIQIHGFVIKSRFVQGPSFDG